MLYISCGSFNLGKNPDLNEVQCLLSCVYYARPPEERAYSDSNGEISVRSLPLLLMFFCLSVPLIFTGVATAANSFNRSQVTLYNIHWIALFTLLILNTNDHTLDITQSKMDITHKLPSCG